MYLKQGDFRGSNALWDYVVVNASWRSYIIHHDQSGFFTPKSQREKGIIVSLKVLIPINWLINPRIFM